MYTYFEVINDKVIKKTALQIFKRNGFSLRTLILLAILGIVVAIASLLSKSEKAETSGLYKVVKVVDGDTIEVKVGEDTQTIRYIGVNTPETVKPNSPVECYGKKASAFNSQLVKDKYVRLEADIEDRDRYSRILRYVYLENGEMVNKKLVEEGYAYSASYPPNVKYQDEFKVTETKAREAKKGLWDECEINK